MDMRILSPHLSTERVWNLMSFPNILSRVVWNCWAAANGTELSTTFPLRHSFMASVRWGGGSSFGRISTDESRWEMCAADSSAVLSMKRSGAPWLTSASLGFSCVRGTCISNLYINLISVSQSKRVLIWVFAVAGKCTVIFEFIPVYWSLFNSVFIFYKKK
jgi:hypothetical protein